MVHERRLEEAHRVVASIHGSRARWYGAEHHATLEALGTLADLLRCMRGREAEAEAAERKVLAAGETLLQLRDSPGGGRPLCRFRSVMYVIGFFGEGAKREHLAERASAFLCKAYIALKVGGLR